MLDLLTKAKNAIEAYNSQLRVNSANIANMSVPGYKTMKISFQTIFENILNSGTPAENGIGGTNPIQYGSSVGISSTWLDFTQGSFVEGGRLDLAVNGSGLFIVSPDGGNTFQYTRAGRFMLDNAGNLVTDTGMLVYGLYNGSLTPITGLADSNTLSWSADGRLVYFTDTTYTSEVHDTGYKIALSSFPNLAGLAQASGNTFTETEASGTSYDAQAPGNVFGMIKPRNYEQSNVFYTGEIIDSMEAQRAMSGNLTIVRMINDEITNFISRIS